jgi:hypothetical protein
VTLDTNEVKTIFLRFDFVNWHQSVPPTSLSLTKMSDQHHYSVNYCKNFLRNFDNINPGNTEWKGRFSTVDLLIKAASFIKSKYCLHLSKAADVNYSVPGGQLYWAFPFIKGSLNNLQQKKSFKKVSNWTNSGESSQNVFWQYYKHFMWRHDTQHNDTQHNDTQHNEK